jgi:hypothetical protein
MAVDREIRRLQNIKEIVIPSGDTKFTASHAPSALSMKDEEQVFAQEGNKPLALYKKSKGSLWKVALSMDGNQYVEKDLDVKGKLNIGGTRSEANQPAFLAFNGGSDLNITVDDWTTIDFSTEVFDVGNNFASDTFTAPVKGLYFLTTQVTLSSLDTDSTGYRVALITSNRTYTAYLDTDQYFDADSSWHVITPITSVCDMDAGDTAYVAVFQTGGAGITDVIGHSTAVLTYFSGYLLG